MMKCIFLLMISLSLSWGVLSLDPTKRLVITIGKDSMNRISVEHDRIAQVFGESESYEIQTEEETGQIFIKPTLENGERPISLTIITENGVTQDLQLLPKDKTSSPIVLKWEQITKTHQTLFEKKSFAFQEILIQSMKILVSGYAPPLNESCNRSNKLNLSLSHLGSYQLSDFKGYKFRIKNKGNDSIDLLEVDFFQEGDQAIAFEKNTLLKGQSSVLYVVTK